MPTSLKTALYTLRRRCAFFKQLRAYKKSSTALIILFAATSLAALLNFGVQVMLARVLGPHQFGAFASALAMVTLVAPLAGFGLGGYWLKVFGKEGRAALRWLPGSFRFLSVSTLLVIAGLFVWALIGPHDKMTATLLMILATVVVGQMALELGSAKLQLEGRYTRLALWQLLPHLLRFTGVMALVLTAGAQAFNAPQAAGVFMVVSVILCALGAQQMLKLARGEFRLSGHANPDEPPSGTDCFGRNPSPVHVIAGAWPFGLAGVFYLIYYQSNIILVKYLVDEAAAGIYSAAFAIMAAVYLFPSVLYQQFLLPKLHRWAYHDTQRMAKVYRIGNFAMLGLGLLAMLLLWLIVPVAVPWFFGEAYRGAVALLMILAMAAPFRFLASSAGAFLVTRDYVQIKILVMAVAALVSVVFNLCFIPIYDELGAALTAIIIEALVSFSYFFISNNKLRSA